MRHSSRWVRSMTAVVFLLAPAATSAQQEPAPAVDSRKPGTEIPPEELQASKCAMMSTDTDLQVVKTKLGATLKFTTKDPELAKEIQRLADQLLKKKADLISARRKREQAQKAAARGDSSKSSGKQPGTN